MLPAADQRVCTLTALVLWLDYQPLDRQLTLQSIYFWRHLVCCDFLGYHRFACSIVLDMLEPMDAERKAYHLIGGVLAERKVGDVKPILQSNREAVSLLRRLQLATLLDHLHVVSVTSAALPPVRPSSHADPEIDSVVE